MPSTTNRKSCNTSVALRPRRGSGRVSSTLGRVGNNDDRNRSMISDAAAKVEDFHQKTKGIRFTSDDTSFIWSLPPLPPCWTLNNTGKVPAYPTREEMDVIFGMCRHDQWEDVYQNIHRNPNICTTPMIMDNHISTTILHQAITSKGDVHLRANVMQAVLMIRPEAAAIKNGYGSLPLHVIAQRNTKMTADIKEKLIYALVKAYPAGLAEQGGVGRRTPIHVLFTDYISSRLTQLMIEACPEATFMKDKNGFLPAHVACSRHCSPQKLQVLLEANPSALYDTTLDGRTLLSLARTTATKSHPNYALIDALTVALRNSPDPQQKDESAITKYKHEKEEDKEEERFVGNVKSRVDAPASPSKATGSRQKRRSTMSSTGKHHSRATSAALVSPSLSSQASKYTEMASPTTVPVTPIAATAATSNSPPSLMRQRIPKRVLAMDDTTTPAAANLLLHFHRNGSPELKQPFFHHPHPTPSNYYHHQPSPPFYYRPEPKRRMVHSYDVRGANDEASWPQPPRTAEV